MSHQLFSLGFVISGFVVFVGCDRFTSPTPEECKAGLSNFIHYTIEDAFDKEFPNKSGDEMTKIAGEFAKGFGSGLLTDILVDDTKIAWCEQNMSTHQAKCMRASQSKRDADACGIGLDKQGKLYKD